MLYLLLWGCSPIEAPEEYDDLASYLYEHLQDDPEYLEVGMSQLYTLLEEESEAIDKGYRLNTLSWEAIQMVDDREDAPADLLGIAKSVDFSYGVDDLAYVNFQVHPRDVFTNPNAVNERTYIGDPECFVAQECEFLIYEAVLQRFLPLNIVATIYFSTEIRWVQTEYGMAFIQRRWLTDDPEINVDWLQVDAGYSLAITLPSTTTATAKQIEHVWGGVALGDLPLPEDGAYMVATDVLGNILGQFEEYLDEHPRPE